MIPLHKAVNSSALYSSVTIISLFIVKDSFKCTEDFVVH